MGLHAIDRWFPGGFWGVDVFFVISAFLITTLILEEIHERQGQYSFRAFYWRRALRLGPALLVWLVFVSAPTAVAVHESDLIVQSTLVSLLYIGDLAAAGLVEISGAHVHVWSLAIEEQFYAVWPLVLVLVATRWSSNVRLTVAVSALPLAVLTEYCLARTTDANYFLPTGHAVPIIAGVVAAHLFVYRPHGAVMRLSRIGIVGAVALMLIAGAYLGYKPGGASTSVLWSSLTAMATAALILHACQAQATAVGRALGSRISVWVGRRSYGLYLYHRTLAVLLPALAPDVRLAIAGPAVLAASLLLAGCSFRYIEAPIARAGRRRLAQRGSML